MVMSIVNARAIQPFVSIVNLVVKKNVRNLQPSGVRKVVTLDNATEVDAGIQIPHVNLVSVYVEGFRLVNSTLDFGATYSSYTISGSKVLFNNPVTGTVLILVELPFNQATPVENTIDIVNVQGAKTTSKTPKSMLAATYCTPLILTQPQHGVAVLADNRQDIVYLPNSDYEGFDAFSYTVISDRGQTADPKCAYVKVGNARETK
jgi:hypothetical protein